MLREIDGADLFDAEAILFGITQPGRDEFGGDLSAGEPEMVRLRGGGGTAAGGQEQQKGGTETSRNDGFYVRRR